MPHNHLPQLKLLLTSTSVFSFLFTGVQPGSHGVESIPQSLAKRQEHILDSESAPQKILELNLQPSGCDLAVLGDLVLLVTPNSEVADAAGCHVAFLRQ